MASKTPLPSSSFTLYKPSLPKVAPVQVIYENKPYDIDPKQMISKSGLFSQVSKNFDHVQNELNKNKAIAMTIQNELDNIVKVYNIDNLNCHRFLKIISGQPYVISTLEIFDLYKLSTHFDIKELLTNISETCKKASKVQDIIGILKKGINNSGNKSEIAFFNEFIDLGDMSKKLSESLQECFKDSNFKNNIPRSALFKIIQKCKSQDKIPPNDLYDIISVSIEEQLRFLPYIDIFRLDAKKQDKLFQSLKEIEKKLKTPNSTQESVPVQDNSGTQNNSLKAVGQKADQSSLLKTSVSNANSKTASSIVGTSSIYKTYSQQPSKPSINSSTSPKDQSKLQNPYKTNSNTQTNDDLIDTNALTGQDDDDVDDFSQQGISQTQIGAKAGSPKNGAPNIGRTNSSNSINSGKSGLYTTTTNQGSLYQTNVPGKEYHPPTSYVNKQRIETFNENRKIINNGSYNLHGRQHYIKKDYDYSIQNTIIVSDRDPLPIDSNIDSKRKKLTPKEREFLYQRVTVTTDSTFAAAMKGKQTSKKVCVLNFASATQPGGGVLNGRNAQEESLSRQSTLYFSLAKMDKFYEYNKQNYDPMGTDFMIYSPNVIILRDDNDKLIDPIKVSVISAVAVNYSEILEKYKHGEKDKDVADAMKKRCRRILELCISKGNDVIVLGAFGCGVFQNSPKVISKIFKELIIDEGYGSCFLKIYFAIKTKSNQTNEMVDTFNNAFRPLQKSKVPPGHDTYYYGGSYGGSYGGNNFF